MFELLPNQRRYKKLVSTKATSLPKSGVCSHDQFDVSFCDLSKCCFRPPLAEPQGCQVCCSLSEHHATSAAQHTGTVLYLKQLPA